ncbi:MAG: hypothetical protein CV087_22300, partial [Candidatus Brocadia sp. WS118]
MQSPWQINDFIPDPQSSKDRWQIYKIFQGGMGLVYIVYDTQWQEVFAVKTYLEKLQSKLDKEQFKKEAEKWINLDRHENVAWARFVLEIQQRPYLFLEYVSGGDLSRWIGSPRLDFKRLLKFAIQFCYGIEHAYEKGIKAHRDIKPQNCLISEDDTLKISDFGLAKALDREVVQESMGKQVAQPSSNLTTTQTGSGGGTVPYMAPEQFQDLKNVDVRADIYSFGVMLYEMISGKRPFYGSSFKEFQQKHQRASIPDLPSSCGNEALSLNELLRKCLAKAPEDRYSGFGEIRTVLKELYRDTFKEAPAVPKSAEALGAIELNNKGVSLGNLGRYEEALSCCDQALAIDRQVAQAWSNKGAMLEKLGRYEEALSCYDQALAIDRQYAKAWYNKGVALEKLGRYEEALSCCDQALAIDRQYAKAWYSKGVALGKLGRYEEEISCYD